MSRGIIGSEFGRVSEGVVEAALQVAIVGTDPFGAVSGLCGLSEADRQNRYVPFS